MLPLSNAAGTVKLVEQARRLASAPIDELVMGSYTVDERDGNSGRVYTPLKDDQRFHAVLNSLGMPNPGSLYLPNYRDELLDLGPDIVVSIAGFNVQEFGLLADLNSWAFGLELNLGCPNIWGADVGLPDQHRIGSFDPDYIDDVLSEAEDVLGRERRRGQVRVKLSPYSDPVLLGEVADICVRHQAVVVASNTFPNGWLPGWGDNGPPYGGVSGPAMKAIVLGQVRQFKEHGVEDVVAAGGVRTGKDLADYEAAGAALVQVGSLYLDRNESPDTFSDLLQDAAW